MPPGARGPRLGDSPKLSVVVASHGTRERLDACLAALLPQCAAHDAELIVSRIGPVGDLEAAYPAVLLVDVPAGTSVAALRAAGMAVADGDVVALTEDHGVASPDWLGQMLAAHRTGVDAIGGAMPGAHPRARGAPRAQGGGDGAPAVSPVRPLLSVIVPAHQGARFLPDTLAALAASALPRTVWELIVVDDASTDGTDVVASQYADTVLRLAGNAHGPAYSRNRAFEFSRGDALVFVDADVRVYPTSLALIAQQFAEDPELGAVFGAYDDAPAAPGVVSQYRNLLHHYVHREGEGDAETFWAGLGAVRRDVFAEAGMFDEWHYSRPQIEDVELGRRIRRLGHRIVLRPSILGKHLKRWTLRDVIRADYVHRGVPWAWLLAREGRAVPERALSLQLDYRVSTGAACLALVALLAMPFIGAGEALALAGLLCVVVGSLNVGFYRVLVRRLGLPRTLLAFPLHLVHYISNGAAAITGWLSHHVLGEPETPASVVALADTGVKTWPPRHARPRASLWTTPPGALTDREERRR